MQTAMQKDLLISFPAPELFRGTVLYSAVCPPETDGMTISFAGIMQDAGFWTKPFSLPLCAGAIFSVRGMVNTLFRYLAERAVDLTVTVTSAAQRICRSAGRVCRNAYRRVAEKMTFSCRMNVLSHAGGLRL